MSETQATVLEPSETKAKPRRARSAQAIALKPPESQETGIVASSPMGLLQMAVSKGAGIEVIERLKALYDQERDRAAEMEFNAAMNRVQAVLTRIAPDLNNSQTNSRYASYAAIDRVLRPIYSKEGFSLSFNTEDSQHPDRVVVVCYVSHPAGHTRKYRVDMPSDGKGAKGGDVMTKTHATGSAMTYGKRYLVNGIFNLAIGQPDDDGNGGNVEWLDTAVQAIAEAPDMSGLKIVFTGAYKEATAKNNPRALLIVSQAYEARKKELTSAEVPF